MNSVEKASVNTVYTVGYAALTPARLKQLAEEKNALIVDIRYSPRSRRLEWNKEALRDELGSLYTHVPAFGNRNYSGEGPIDIAAPSAGLRIFRQNGWLESKSVILLCQCRDYTHCHRKVVAEYLQGILGAPVAHLDPAAETPSGMIKAITLTQPWATLVAIGAKRFETRSWQPPLRGDCPVQLAIHAGKGTADFTLNELRDLCAEEPFCSALSAAGYHSFDELPRGAVVAVAELCNWYPTPTEERVGIEYRDGVIIPPPEPERSFGNYAPGRFAWKLANVRRLREPLHVRGAQGLWNIEAAPVMALLG